MKNLRVLFLLIACFLCGSYAMAQPVVPPALPTVSVGASEVWYYIKFTQRQWPTNSGARYLYDAGDQKLLIVMPPIASSVSDKLQWKIVEPTPGSGQYRIVSKAGNGIEYHCCMWGPGLNESVDRGDRFYTSATSTQLYLIEKNNKYPTCHQIRRVGETNGAIDKNLDCAGFDAWTHDDGTALQFEPVATTVLTPPSPSLGAYLYGGQNPTRQASNFSFAVSSDSPTDESEVIYMIGYNIPNATITANIEGTAKDFLRLSKVLQTGADGVIMEEFRIVCELPSGTAVGNYSATLTLTDGGSMEAQPITLNVTVVGFPDIVLSSLDDTDEHWYYLFTAVPGKMKTGNVIADVSVGGTPAKLEQFVADTKTNGRLLWKFVKESNGKFWIINKETGNYITYNQAGNNKFSTGPAASNTFMFLPWTGAKPADCWRLKCNEINNEINKDDPWGSTVPTFGAWTGANDPGNAIKFVAENSPETDELFPQQPDLSLDADEYWYQIVVIRQNKAIEDVAPNQDLKQMPVAETFAQYWKVMGTSNSAVTLESYAGNECFWNSGAGRYYSSDDGSVTEFELMRNSLGIYWMLKESGNYLEDSYEAGDFLGRWSDANNSGAFLLFKKVPLTCNVSATALDFGTVTEKSNLSVDVVMVNTNNSAAYEIVENTNGAFAIDESATVWNANRGGTIKINFTPPTLKAATTIKDCTATLEIKVDGASVKTVELSGSYDDYTTAITQVVKDDSVVSEKYYNLQGVEVTNPSVQGVYIVKKVYASGKTQVVKQLVVVK